MLKSELYVGGVYQKIDSPLIVVCINIDIDKRTFNGVIVDKTIIEMIGKTILCSMDKFHRIDMNKIVPKTVNLTDGIKYQIPGEYTVIVNDKELFLVKSTKYFIRESIDEIVYIKANNRGGTMIVFGANGFIDIKQYTRGRVNTADSTAITKEEFETVYKETLLKFK